MRFSAFKAGLLMGVGLGLAIMLSARPVLAGDKVEYASPSSKAGTNSNAGSGSLDLNKSFSKQIEDDLFRPFDSMNQPNSLEPVLPEFKSPQGSTQSKRERELQDRKRNWAFVDPNDQFLTTTNNDDPYQLKEYGSDGQEKPGPGVIDKYYNDLGKRRGLSALEMSQQPGAGRNRDFAGTNAYNRLKFGFSTNEQAWSFSDSDHESSLPPWVKDGKSASPEEIKAKELHRSEFHKLLDGRATASDKNAPSGSGNPSVSDFLGIAGIRTGEPASFDSPDEAAKARPATPVVRTEYHNPAAPAFAASQTPNLRPHVLDDPTLRALGLPQPQPSLFLTNAQPATPPTLERAVEFSLPQRKF